MADEQNKAVSFSFVKKKDTKKLQNTSKNVLGSEHGHVEHYEKDFIRSAEGKALKSINPKEEPKEAVIPLLKKNRWILPSDSKVFDGLDKEAAEEVMKDALRDLQTKEQQEEDLSIPMLMRNKLPEVEGYEQDERLDIAMRPEVSTADDYDTMPVGSFGAAMLRGMGWKKGEAIGGTVKGLAEPIEYIPRSKGLGLGAERKTAMPSKRRRKPGDPKEKVGGPIVEKDGRVRHVKGVGEKISNATALDYEPDTGAVIEKGPHRDLHGRIISVDIDNSRVTVRLHISSENVTLHQFHVRLIDEEDYKNFSKNVKSKKSDEDRHKDSEHRSSKRRKEDLSDEDNSKQSKHREDKHSNKHQESKHETYTMNGGDKQPINYWVHPQIRVRMISKEFKKGRYYNTKIKILDVVSQDSCICETEDGKLIEDVSQSMLETVVPKSENAYVRIVKGSNKGQLGTVLRRDTSKYEVMVQFLLDKGIKTLHYDDVSEYTGDIREDLM